MRNFISLMLSFCIIMASVPVVALFYKNQTVAAQKTQSTSAQATTAQSAAQNADNTDTAAVSTRKSDKVAVFLHKENKTVSADTDFYILSVLAKEIDINAPDEALKAQAVCIYTFLKHAREQNDASDYDITDNPAHHQAFLTRGQLHTFWGENYEANYQKLQKIVAAVKGQYMSYKGQTVLAAYHSSNAGKTESAAVYWGENYPYLQPVTSIGDTLCPAYMTKVVFSPEEFKSALSKAKDKTFHFPESPSDWLGEINTSPSGTVTDVTLADVTLTGREMRDLLSLKSSFFTLRYVGGNFLLKVSGYGHGVGLSQEGAKYMASLGFSYKDILCHYYNGVEIKEENAV